MILALEVCKTGVSSSVWCVTTPEVLIWCVWMKCMMVDKVLDNKSCEGQGHARSKSRDIDVWKWLKMKRTKTRITKKQNRN